MARKYRCMAVAGFLWLVLSECWAAPPLRQIGPGLYAYISDNDASANCTVLVGSKGILVVDTGFDANEGAKLLRSIRFISALPVQYIVNTHYHLDHQGGNSSVGPAAMVISTDWTRNRTLELMKAPAASARDLRPAELTFEEKITIHVDPFVAEVYFPGKAHTSGDALVYFPSQHSMAMGDLFLNRSSPAMDQGSVENWIRALDQVLQLPLKVVVPGHFELATKSELRLFRDYLFDLYQQVQAIYRNGGTVDEVRRRIHMEKYNNFRQYPKFEATFVDNAESIYHQLQLQH